jgi:2-dehydropantoate 2-reductase
MRKNQVSAILPALAANRHTPNVLFMGNNVAGPDEMVEALGRERILLGFPGAAGHREGYVVTVKVTSGRQQPTTFGELDGRTTPRLQEIVEAFKSAGFPVAINSNMDAWLKTHIAEVGPAANAIYMAGGDNYRLARTRDGLVLMVRAIREGYRVLRALGVPITPANHKIFEWIPEPILVALMRRLLNTKTAEIEIAGHANAARDEFKQLADDFRALARTTSVPTPAMDRLYTYIDPAVPPLPEGSAQISPSWRSV